jgi:voltage-gated potassium channel
MYEGYLVNNDGKHQFEVRVLSERLFAIFSRIPLLISILMITSIIMVLFGNIIHFLEPENFPTSFDGIWWAVVTASTVGFGDLVPKTVPGKVTGIFLILIGASVLTYYFANLATAAVTLQKDFVEGKRDFKGKGHIIIVGWNEKSRKIIASLSGKKPPKNIILIDETLKKLPIHETHGVHFIRGKAINDETLFKANLSGAECIIITADQNKTEMLADMGTIITLLAIKGINPSVKCIVEILTSEQTVNAQRAGADEIIQTNLLISTEMLNLI